MNRDLYNQRIIEAARRAREQQPLDAPDIRVTRDNPLCGDRITLDLQLEDGRIAAIGHRTRGCLLTEAAAAILAERGRDATLQTLRRVRDDLARLLAGEMVEPVWPELAVFRPVAEVKSRHECVLLPFDAALDALSRAARETS